MNATDLLAKDIIPESEETDVLAFSGATIDTAGAIWRLTCSAAHSRSGMQIRRCACRGARSLHAYVGWARFSVGGDYFAAAHTRSPPGVIVDGLALDEGRTRLGNEGEVIILLAAVGRAQEKAAGWWPITVKALWLFEPINE